MSPALFLRRGFLWVFREVVLQTLIQGTTPTESNIFFIQAIEVRFLRNYLKQLRRSYTSIENKSKFTILRGVLPSVIIFTKTLCSLIIFSIYQCKSASSLPFGQAGVFIRVPYKQNRPKENFLWAVDSMQF